MKLIDQHYEILTPKYPNSKELTQEECVEKLLDIVYKQIEEAAKNCYQSSHTITEGSAKSFVKGLIKAGHYAPLEFGSIYLTIPNSDYTTILKWLGDNELWKYSRARNDSEFIYITTTYRVIIEYDNAENNLMEDLNRYLTPPTSKHILRKTVKLTTNRQVMGEITRHRKASFCIESTRFNNYSKDELVFIKPNWLDLEGADFDIDTSRMIYGNTLSIIEKQYNALIRAGWKPQQAASILPNSTKCTIYMGAYEDDWDYIFRLRTSIIAETGKPHPQMSELMDKMYKDFTQETK